MKARVSRLNNHHFKDNLNRISAVARRAAVGSNPNLVPETGDTCTMGLTPKILAPQQRQLSNEAMNFSMYPGSSFVVGCARYGRLTCKNAMITIWKKPLSLLFLLSIISYWPSLTLAASNFENVSATAGLAYQHADLTAQVISDVGDMATMSGGAAAGDFDGDGWMDLYVTRVNLPNQLFRNKGDGTFEEVGAAAGVDLHSLSAGCAWADIDNDGDQDLFVVTFETRNYLYINDGTGHFQEEAVARQVDFEHDLGKHYSTSAAFGDVDNDGDLDLLITAWQLGEIQRNDPQTRLFINDGQGNFSDNTDNAGLTTPTAGFSPAFADVDRDGWQDILIAADFKSSVYYHNQGNGVFVDQTEAAGVGTDENGMGSSVMDIDNDGDLDWFVSAIYDPTECEGVGGCFWFFSGNRLYLNDGQGQFEDGTESWGVRDGGWGWGASGIDIENDGDLDLILANGMSFDLSDADDQFNDGVLRLWENNGNDKPMTDIAVEAGALAVGETRGVVVFDYDQDGDQDFYVVNNNRQPSLFENVGTDSGHWFRVRVRGTRSNKDGAGAIVRLTTADGQVHTRIVGNNSNYNSHNEPTVHFGLGEATGVVTLEVEWPVSGWVQRFTDLAVDQVLSVEEAEPTVVDPPKITPNQGMYWDRGRSGHGFDLQRSGDTWFFLLYTYRTDNTPLWYLALGEVIDGVFTGTATQFYYDPGSSPPQQAIVNTGGATRIDFAADSNESDDACDDGIDRSNALSTAIFDFELDGQQGQWCVEPFQFAGGSPTLDFTGSWFNSEDPGWGLTVATQGSGSEQSLVVVLYYYDADQQPRWALGSVSNVDLGNEVEVEMLQFSGFCPGCLPSEPASTPAGTVRLTLVAPSLDLNAGNTASVNVEFLGAPGGTWLRTEDAIQLLSDPLSMEPLESK